MRKFTGTGLALIAAVTVALVFAASGASAQTFDKRTAKKLGEVIEHLQEERFAEAEGLLESINIKRQKAYGASTVYEMFAHVNAGQEKFEQAGKYFKLALDAGGFEGARQNRLRLQLGQIYMMLSQWQNAIDEITIYFQEAEDPSPDAYYRLAVAHYSNGDQARARKPAILAIKKSKNPKESHMRLLLALYMESKEYKRAIPLLERLVTYFPKKAYWMQISAVYNELGREVEALASQQLAHRQGMLVKDKELRRLAQLYLYHDLPYRAGLVLEEALESEVVESNADAWELLGNSWLSAKEYDRALPPLEKAAVLAETGDLYARLGRVYIQQEKWTDASSVLLKAVEKGSLEDEGNTLLLYGVSLYNEGKLKTARRQFVKSLEYENSRKYAEQWIKVVDRELE
jgi:tetratricopeptide (TPR) repeat protein